MIDEDKDGKFSTKEIKTLGNDMMPELQKYGFMTWLNTGDKDFRPPKRPHFSARIDDPATFKPPDWDSTAGDGGQPMPENKRAPSLPFRRSAVRAISSTSCASSCRTPQTFSITTYDPDDFIRIEVDARRCRPAARSTKHPTHKAEFIRGYPVPADLVSCQPP